MLTTKVFECNSQLSLKTIFDIRKFIKQEKISIIHTHGYKSNFYGILSTLLGNVTLVCTCHPWLETNDSFKAKFYAWLDKKFLLKRFDSIVAVSADVKNEIIVHGVSEDMVSIINNGINIHRFSSSHSRRELCNKFDIKADSKIVGTIGRLAKEKAQDIFIEAAKLVSNIIPESYFMIVGDGPLEEELKNRVNALDLQDHIIFTGVSDNIPELLSLMDVFVLPSLSEGLPMVLLEAMAAQKPIIATNVGAIPIVIIDNETGILIEPKDADQLSKAVTDLIKNKDKADLLSRNAYNKVVSEFSAESMAKQYINIYEQM